MSIAESKRKQALTETANTKLTPTTTNKYTLPSLLIDVHVLTVQVPTHYSTAWQEEAEEEADLVLSIIDRYIKPLYSLYSFFPSCLHVPQDQEQF